MKFSLLAITLFTCSSLNAQTGVEVPLYKGQIPNSRPAANKEAAIFKDDVTRIEKVSVPTLTIYKPSTPNGKAVIICPGGGYSILAFDKEGTRVATEMNKWGVTALVLKYRLPSDSFNVDRSLAPLQDAQQAIRYARTNATELGINPNQIGIMGFSAGGHLASTAATHFQRNADPTSAGIFCVSIFPSIQ